MPGGAPVDSELELGVFVKRYPVNGTVSFAVVGAINQNPFRKNRRVVRTFLQRLPTLVCWLDGADGDC